LLVITSHNEGDGRLFSPASVSALDMYVYVYFVIKVWNVKGQGRWERYAL